MHNDMELDVNTVNDVLDTYDDHVVSVLQTWKKCTTCGKRESRLPVEQLVESGIGVQVENLIVYRVCEVSVLSSTNPYAFLSACRTLNAAQMYLLRPYNPNAMHIAQLHVTGCVIPMVYERESYDSNKWEDEVIIPFTAITKVQWMSLS